MVSTTVRDRLAVRLLLPTERDRAVLRDHLERPKHIDRILEA